MHVHSLKQPSPEQREFRERISHRLAGLRQSFASKMDSGTVMAPDDIAVMHDKLGELVRDARVLEGDFGGKAHINTSIPPALQLLCEVGDIAAFLRSTLIQRMEEREADPRGYCASKIAEAQARLQKAAELLARGGGRPS